MKFVFRAVLSLVLCLPVLAGSPVLHLKYGAIDTSVKAAPKAAADNLFVEAFEPGEQRLYLVQFNGPITLETRSMLESAGLLVADYVPDNAYVVWGTGHRIAALNDPAIQWKGVYQPAYRVDRSLQKIKSDRVRVRIVLYPFADEMGCRFTLADAGCGLDRIGRSKWQTVFVTTVSTKMLPVLASMPGVKWVEPYVEPKLYSAEMPDVAVYSRKDEIKNQVSHDIMNVTPVWNAGHTGASQVAAVCDTGLDVGSVSSIHADFYNDADSNGTNDKIVAAYALGRTGDWSDDNGHGTHTAGSVLGNGARSSGQFRGNAYQARLVMQSVLDSRGGLGGLPSDLNDLFQQAYDDGARIHSNSWGAAVAGSYDSSSQQLDQFVWDNRDMVITVSAGNEGTDGNRDGVVDLDSIGSPATAKNCITVGATESDINATSTTWGAAWSTDYPTNPVKDDPLSDNRNGMAAFSSRGPTNDGRIKPDVSAPGTMIISVRSQDSAAGTGWGVYDDYYVYMGGTSMSNPLTAGGAVLVREYFIQQEGIAPSAALVKATLMNAAYDIYPGQYGTGTGQEISTVRPNNVEGWGRVDLGTAVKPVAPNAMQYVDNTTGISTGTTRTYTYSVSDSSVPFHVTLAWTDYPASTSSSVQLVNDLDLRVEGPGGTTYYPNRRTSADHTNNVETVDISTPAAGTYTVYVNGYNVPQGPQPYALVAHGGFGTVDPDTTPPVISGVGANPSYDSATITWTTDETATSVVNYGTTTSLGSSETVSGYAISHSVELTGLSAETTYYYRVQSADTSGNTSTGSILSFTTEEEPVMPTSFADDMESGDSKWTKSPAGSSPWAITATSYARSGGYALFSADEASIKDDSIATYQIDFRGASVATLSFYHTYKMESNYDGCVIEISTNDGGSWTDLGSKITTGGYTGTISTQYSSPISGRSAWTGGTLGTMTEVSADLTDYVGNIVLVRFRLACDSSVSSTGWYVDDVSITSSGSVPAPTIDSFGASPSTIDEGQSATLSWTTTNATSCTINGSAVAVDGSTTVSPTSTTTYTLTATGAGGSVSQNVTVTVNEVTPPPTIDSFSASPATIDEGQSATLSWATTNATSCTINGSAVAVDGSTSVSPTVTTTYTLTATGDGGTVSQNVTVTVNAVVPAPTIDTFSASPATIDQGQSATLTWTTTNATSCTINGSSVAVDGSMTVSPSSTTSYTLTATGDGGTVNQDVTVTVNSDGQVDTRTFSSGDVPKSIPDNSSAGVTSTLNVTDGYGILSFQVSVDITHTYIGDLEVTLTSPSGTTVMLHDNAGGSANNINETYTVTAFNGQDAVGTWTLKAVDSARRDTGTIDNWSITVEATYNSASYEFASADTPISIPDNNSTGITSTISVPASATVTSFDVTVNITHTYIGDLVVTLYTPGGSSVVLSDREGGSANDINKTWTVDATGGVAINGNWQLKVTDNAGYDTGTLDNWKLKFSY